MTSNIGGTPANNWFVRVFNVDDLGRVYININNLVLEVPYGQEGSIDITPYLDPGYNTVRFLVYNYEDGYTWGFELLQNGSTYWSSTAGIVGVVGAFGNDQSHTNKWVFDEILAITK